jgi:hypothetical protein
MQSVESCWKGVGWLGQLDGMEMRRIEENAEQSS